MTFHQKKFGYEKACENFMYKSTKSEKLPDCQSFADGRMNADCKSWLNADDGRKGIVNPFGMNGVK